MRPPRRTRPGGGFSGPFVTSKAPSCRMNEPGPRERPHSGLHPRFGTRRSGGRGEGGREERPQSFTRCAICDTLLYNAGERRALSGPQSLSSEGEKRAAEILYGARAKRGGPLAARSHTRTTWTRLFLLFLSSFLLPALKGRKRKRSGRSLFSHSSGWRKGGEV